MEVGEVVLVNTDVAGGDQTLLPGGEMQISSPTDWLKFRQLLPSMGFPIVLHQARIGVTSLNIERGLHVFNCI